MAHERGARAADRRRASPPRRWRTRRAARAAGRRPSCARRAGGRSSTRRPARGSETAGSLDGLLRSSVSSAVISLVAERSRAARSAPLGVGDLAGGAPPSTSALRRADGRRRVGERARRARATSAGARASSRRRACNHWRSLSFARGGVRPSRRGSAAGSARSGRWSSPRWRMACRPASPCTFAAPCPHCPSRSGSGGRRRRPTERLLRPAVVVPQRRGRPCGGRDPTDQRERRQQPRGAATGHCER